MNSAAAVDPHPPTPAAASTAPVLSSDADTTVDLPRRGARAVRVHRQGRRPRPALHALVDGPRRPGRARHGGLASRRRLRVRGGARRRARRCGGARPRRRLRRASPADRRGEDLPRRSRRDARQSPRAALGAGAGLRCAAVSRARTRRGRTGAGLLRRRVADRDGADRAPQRRLAAAAVRGPLPALPPVGAAGGGTSPRTRRGPDRAALSPRRFPPRPARAVGGGLQGRERRLLPARAGAHRHRQDGGHAVPAAQGLRGAAPGQAVLPDREDPGPRAGARGTGRAARERRRTAAARARTGRARQGLRAPGQGLPRRLVPAGARLLRPPAGGARGRAAGGVGRQGDGAPGGPRSPGLPLLPGPGPGALERRGGRGLQPLLRPECRAARARAVAGVARRPAGRRGAQPDRTRPRDVLGVPASRRPEGGAGEGPGGRRQQPAAARPLLASGRRRPGRALSASTQPCGRTGWPRCSRWCRW